MYNELTEEQITRLSMVMGSRLPIVRAAYRDIWITFVCDDKGLEYSYQYPMTQKDLDFILNGEQVKEEPKVKSKQVDNDRRPQETSLTPRQWELYRLIKHNSLVEHRKTSQKEICERINGYVWNDEESVHDHCPAVWSDVKDNNLSFEHQHLIISDKFEYWIGSERECQEFLKKLWNDIAPRLHRYWQYVKLLGYDGQGRLYDKNLNPISNDDYVDNAKMFICSFNEYDIEMQKEAD